MTTPAQSRPVPDTDDLRLLAEIINNGVIGLPQAAWNARMSQSEAAARLVTMAERGMPLRLVAEGDRQALWHIAQAGPATGGVPVQQLPVILPPSSAVPPHEQAIAGAVPLGRPPFGPPTDAQAEVSAVPAASPVTTWGVPGSSDWVRSPEEAPDPVPAAPAESPDSTQFYPAPSLHDEYEDEDGVQINDPGVEHASSGDRPPGGSGSSPMSTPLPAQSLSKPALSLGKFDAPTPADSPTAVAAQATPAPPAAAPEDAPQRPSPTHRVMTSGQPTQSTTGLFNERLDVTLQQIIDPADVILTAVGYRLEPHERALLVQTAIGNPGPIDFESLPDLYLALRGSTGAVLAKAAMAVAGYPAHRVGVPAGTQSSGWTVFLVPGDTEVTEVLWSVRPDLVNRTISWGFGPG